MRVVIIPEDNRVSVEGFSESVDCSALDQDIRVIQWYGDAGEIEFYHHDKIKLNEPITELHSFQYLVDAWMVEAKKESPIVTG